MFKIDICSIDKPFLSKIEKPLIMNLNSDEFNKDAVIISRQDCLFNQVLRLITTYQAIEIAKQTKFIIDCAKDTQLYREILINYEKTDKAVFTFGSTILDITYDLQAQLKQIDKVLMKHFIRRGIRKPNLIIYLNLDFEALKSKRIKFPRRYNIEESLRGKAVLARHRKMPLLLEQINKKFKVPYAIIEIGSKTPYEISNEILKVAKEHYENRQGSNNWLPTRDLNV